MSVINIDTILKSPNLIENDSAMNHPLFPQVNETGPYRWLISGPSGSGKTNVVISSIIQSQIKINHLYLYARDPSQPKYQFLLQWINTMEDLIKKELKQKVSLCTVITEPKDIIPVDSLDPKVNSLAVFDDMMMEKHQEKIHEYFVRGRHRSVSCVYLSQAYHSTPTIIRKNCNYFTVFSPTSQNEIMTISKDLAMTYEYKEFKKILHEATSHKKNDFLFIDLKTEIDILKLRRNFTEIWNKDTQTFEHLPIEFINL